LRKRFQNSEGDEATVTGGRRLRGRQVAEIDAGERLADGGERRRRIASTEDDHPGENRYGEKHEAADNDESHAHGPPR
jgi:hypothetical protein